MYEIGVGIDFYLEYFKFSPEFKATFGLLDMLVKEETIYSSSIKKNVNSWVCNYPNL